MYGVSEKNIQLRVTPFLIFGIIKIPNLEKVFELYYKLKINNTLKLDELNGNTKNIDGIKYSYYLYQPK